MAEPRISADGRFYWDGEAWRPMPPAAPAQRHYPWTAGPWGCVGVLVLIGVLVFFAFCSLVGGK